MSYNTKIAIIYLSYHCEPYIDDVIDSLKKISYPKDLIEFVIVDNPHKDFPNSADYIRKNILPLSGKEIPHVTFLPQSINTGFAGGNNVGIQWASENGFEYIYWLNNDAFLSEHTFEPIIDAMLHEPTIAVAQSLILLEPSTGLINTTGNEFHYLGFGYCNNYKTPVGHLKLEKITDISYASGAGMMMRSDLYRKFGGLDEDFFLYHEDTDYSFRHRLAGLRVVLVSDSVIYHKYDFSRSIQKYYWMERNRYAILLMYFKIWSLLLLLPMLCILEIGLFIFSFPSGWWREKLRVYRYWLSVKNWKLWLVKRRAMQKLRVVKDRVFFETATSEILFQESVVQPRVLKYFGNPLMKWYYRIIIRGLIHW